MSRKPQVHGIMVGVYFGGALGACFIGALVIILCVESVFWTFVSLSVYACLCSTVLCQLGRTLRAASGGSCCSVDPPSKYGS